LQKQKETAEVLKEYESLQEAGAVKKWGVSAGDALSRRNVSMGELKMVGIKDPGMIAVASVRNDMAFLVTVVGVTSVLAVAGTFLPGALRHAAVVGFAG
jgi:hypothetical protein